MSESPTMLRLAEAMSEYSDCVSVVIDAMVDVIPPSAFRSDDVQQAMNLYRDGASKWLAAAAVFMAQRQAQS